MKVLNAFKDYLLENKYNIGFIDGDIQSVIERDTFQVNWLKHNYKDRWFADPFILKITKNKIFVLVEEWYDPIQRGRISKLTINRTTFELESIKPILESSTHLSFPAIKRQPDGIYVYPENSATGKLIEYKYNEEMESLEESSILATLPLTDSICNNFFEKDLLFSTKLPDANGKDLGIYQRDPKSGQYHLMEYYHFQENISRMAGDFFIYNGKVYRPAQVCIKSYGDAVSLQEVSYENGVWNFKEIKRLYSPSPVMDLGFHTFNYYEGMIVVDALGFRHQKLSHFFRRFKHLL